ncbi:Outer envelope pore protein 37, chloroplastic [Morella rubra]|uniref:Outer envelope pore protein 37, chloroplastic n=1 Tax=Morella rubra TaxID=262757 RepID=A0A6A1VZW2_9ROSI|nr:Outer envelope pore protein 37, chloroplastic [Morella rubra]
MLESDPPTPCPNHLAPQPPPLPPPPPPPSSKPTFTFPQRPPVRITSEFDSDTSVFFHKISCKFLNSLAKLKLSFRNDHKGDIIEPQVSFISQHLSIFYDVEDQNALLKTSLEVGPRLQLRAVHDVKAQQGQLSMLANLADPGYALELSSSVPSVGVPRATLKFPLGEVSIEERDEEQVKEEEVKRTLSINGIIKGQILNGACIAQYKDEDLKLRYCYKCQMTGSVTVSRFLLENTGVDEEMSFIPSISLPSNAFSFAFKRRFGPSDKLSYWYNFDSNFWSAVYKHTYGNDFKFKAGYDSEVRLGWASLWVGDEAGKAKTAPMKMKVQFMLQVPQDDIRSSALMFRVKKRWDI